MTGSWWDTTGPHGPHCLLRKAKKKIWSLSLVCLGINVFLIWSACPWAWQQNVLGRELLKRLIIYIISGYFPTLLDAVIPQGNLSAPSNTKLLSVFCLDIFAVGAERSLEVTSWSLEPWCLIVGIALNPSWSATCIRVSKGARNCPYPSGLTCCSDFLRNLDAPIHISLLTPLLPSLSLFIYLYFFNRYLYSKVCQCLILQSLDFQYMHGILVWYRFLLLSYFSFWIGLFFVKNQRIKGEVQLQKNKEN